MMAAASSVRIRRSRAAAMVSASATWWTISRALQSSGPGRQSSSSGVMPRSAATTSAWPALKRATSSVRAPAVIRDLPPTAEGGRSSRPISCRHLPSPAARRPALPVPADLRGVVVGMGGVDLEEALGRVGAQLTVDAGPLPVGVRHDVHDLAGGGPGGLERLEARLHRPVLVAEPPRVLFLVVALDHRLVLGQEPPQPDGRDRL